MSEVKYARLALKGIREFARNRMAEKIKAKKEAPKTTEEILIRATAPKEEKTPEEEEEEEEMPEQEGEDILEYEDDILQPDFRQTSAGRAASQPFPTKKKPKFGGV